MVASTPTEAAQKLGEFGSTNREWIVRFSRMTPNFATKYMSYLRTVELRKILDFSNGLLAGKSTRFSMSCVDLGIMSSMNEYE